MLRISDNMTMFKELKPTHGDVDAVSIVPYGYSLLLRSLVDRTDVDNYTLF